MSVVGISSALDARQPRRSTGRGAKAARQIMARAIASKAAPALSVAVAGEQGLYWAEAAGQADLERAFAATSAHLFPLGSVSKLLTATVAAKLATRGVIDLDAPIARWMPDLPEQHRQTTLRQLLTHRGGIRHYDKAETDMGSAGGAVYMRFYASEQDALKLFIGDPLVAAPGAEVRYSSYGYTLASAAMATAAQAPFLDLVAREVAAPFGLSSLKPNDPWVITPGRAGRYMNDMDVKLLCASLAESAKPQLTDGWANLPFDNPAYCWAGAGFLMTPSDAARFGAAMMGSAETAVTRAERELLLTPVTAATKGAPPLGLGWRIDADKKGRRRWHHAGATPGGCYLLAVYPDQRLSVALAGNVMTMKMNVLQAASDIVDGFAG